MKTNKKKILNFISNFYLFTHQTPGMKYLAYKL